MGRFFNTYEIKEFNKNEAKELINTPIRAAGLDIKVTEDASDFVYEKTGFPIGGVAPFGHKIPIEHIFIDRDLMQFETIWCAGGTPHAVFEITPQKLIEITHAKIADIKE